MSATVPRASALPNRTELSCAPLHIRRHLRVGFAAIGGQNKGGVGRASDLDAGENSDVGQLPDRDPHLSGERGFFGQGEIGGRIQRLPARRQRKLACLLAAKVRSYGERGAVQASLQAQPAGAWRGQAGRLHLDVNPLLREPLAGDLGIAARPQRRRRQGAIGIAAHFARSLAANRTGARDRRD